jgi:glycosyltransferase involved in cell wall biosynthesis
LKTHEKIPASVAITAYNEEYNISRCLDSVRGFEDIVVVVDSKTTDKTAEIAEGFGCRVYVEDWRGSGPQKQSSIDKCMHDWVLLLDADESLTPEAFETIRNLVGNTAADAYSFRRRAYIGSRWIKHCGWWPDRLVRFFDRRKCRMASVNHPRVAASGRVCKLNDIINHYSYRDYSHLVSKINRFSAVDSMELFKKDKSVNVLTPVTHAGWKFIRSFVIHRGFMGGLDGLVVSVSGACKTFFKYARLLEMQRNKD